MKVSFNGFNSKELTFICDDSSIVGFPVKITENSTVSKCNEGDGFVGICTQADSENAVVQLTGHVKINYSGSAPVLGRNTLVCGEDDTVKASADGVPCTVLNVNTTEMTVEFLF